MKAENFKNDLYHIINSAEIGDLGLLNGYLYTNTDDTRKHSAIKLILAITNYKKKSINKDNNLPILIYKNNEYVIPLKYFTAFFPSFFLFGIKGHVFIVYNFKKENILLKIWGK